MRKTDKKPIIILVLAIILLICFVEYAGILCDTNDIPKGYFRDEIADTVEKVKKFETEPALVFLLCSDIHYMSIQGKRLKLDTVTDMTINMAALKKQIHVDGLICLGDVVDAKSPTKTAETMEQIRYVMRRLKGVDAPLIYCMGNHDDNRYAKGLDGKAGSEYFTTKQLNSLFMSHTITNKVIDESMDGLNYYVDYDKFKIRVFVLNSNYQEINGNQNWKYGFSDNTVTWFKNQMNQVQSGWSVLLLTHRWYVREDNSKKQWMKNQQQILNIVNSFISSGGKFIATIYGHSHIDYSQKKTFLEIAIAAQKCQNLVAKNYWPVGSSAPFREINTATEDLWDVLIIRPESQTVNTIRFGAGKDREWTY